MSFIADLGRGPLLWILPFLSTPSIDLNLNLNLSLSLNLYLCLYLYLHLNLNFNAIYVVTCVIITLLIHRFSFETISNAANAPALTYKITAIKDTPQVTDSGYQYFQPNGNFASKYYIYRTVNHSYNYEY